MAGLVFLVCLGLHWCFAQTGLIKLSIFRVADADAVAKKHELQKSFGMEKAAKRTSGVGLSTLGAFGFGFNGFIFLGWHAILGVSHLLR